MKKRASHATEYTKKKTDGSENETRHPGKRFFWVLTLLWMLLIFYLSHQPATASKALSGGLLDWMLTIFPAGFSHISFLHLLLRKAAHLSAYFILGVLVAQAIGKTKTWSLKTCIYALLICAVYAMTDEVHQLFIPGRSGEMKDVLIDTIGAAFGISCWTLWKQWWKK